MKRAPRAKKVDATASASTVNATTNTTVNATTVNTTSVNNTTVNEKGRKSKKPINVVAVVGSDGSIQGNFVPEPRRPLIAHLQIHSSEVQFHDMPIQYDPAPPLQPEPYMRDDLFASSQEILPEEAAAVASIVVTEQVSVPTVKDAPVPPFTRSKLMVQFEEASTAHQLPDSTEIACFWCVHPFDTQPCVIPEREDKGVYRVYGNFCSAECGASYLLREPMDPHVRWERMALLHRIYDPNGEKRIFPSPARETLKVFGGSMTIESYRATVKAGKVRVDLHMPPMVSILGSIDTKPIDFFDSNLKNILHSAPGAVAEKVRDTGDGSLRLKRSKPLKDLGSTLDSVMNFQIKGVRAKN
jgi:hypothetical protein